ncbi:MAG: beta galactosidase jelly roll domain-containing protein [Bacteroidetes bacterium]|nr:beta galactosidase jelly roll domain-containing protein [Bacteroidota bacterium]
MRSILILFLSATALFAIENKQPKQFVDLRGTWKFEIGDNKRYAEPAFDDKKWSDIFVPANWENEGFPGYDGYAWYRKSFTLPADAKGKRLVLNLGFVDDVCAVYVNGALIGEGGRFEPDYQTGYDREQRFLLPDDVLQFGKENVIAVRVYDAMQGGGIVRGRIGITEERSEINFVYQFPQRWKFSVGNDEKWKEPGFSDKGWKELIVPARWDFQGFRDYDGYAWYRITFDLPSTIKREELVIMLGKIDDVDETFLNGERIGRTGRVRNNGSISSSEDYQKIRSYSIPNGLLKEKGNVLAVRVYDGLMDGGIYEGPIGIVTEKESSRYGRGSKRWQDESDNPVDRFFEKIFSK